MTRAFVLAMLVGCQDPTTPASPSDSGTPPEPVPFCVAEDFGREVAWDAAGPYGSLRHDLADDFTVTLDDGTDWTLSEHWTGCESYLFIPDWIEGVGNAGSVWDQDLDALIDRSPDNVHYFFVSMATDAPTANAALDAMAAQRDDVIAGLRAKKAEWWSERIHVVKKRADKLDNWVGELLQGSVGQLGFAIDRTQRIRGIGSLADVERYNAAIGWWDNNLAYAAKEVELYNVEAEVQARLEAQQATVVPVFQGEVLSQFEEADVTLPSAAEMAEFDTFEIAIEMRCPDPTLVEFGNCGAWDYLAYLFVQEEDESWTELGRFITTYHREAKWVADATPMMAHLLDGGTRRFKWEWAPPWNVQPTSTYLSLRFSNQGKGIAPVSAVKVATGGAFGSLYNDGRVAAEVEIPADAVKVELVTNVTGHGAGTNQCAEFCNHQHEFTVGSASYLVEFPEAGTESGCADDGVANQMTPNQWGTWWFGRGGWCPGQPVIPQIVDITGDVTAGQTASVAYQGLYQGDTPPDGSGDILLNSWVVVYR